jgi:hypothetical protein
MYHSLGFLCYRSCCTGYSDCGRFRVCAAKVRTVRAQSTGPFVAGYRTRDFWDRRRASSCETASIASIRVRLALSFFEYVCFGGMRSGFWLRSGCAWRASRSASGSWKMLSGFTLCLLSVSGLTTCSPTLISWWVLGWEASHVRASICQRGL